MLSLIMLAALAVFILLAFFRATMISWLLAIMVIVPVVAIQAQLSESVLQVVYVLLGSGLILFGVPYVRRHLLSTFVFRHFRKNLPPVSDTTESGWWDADLFSGHPDWNKLRSYPAYELKPREQAFLDTEVEQLCAMIDDWDITHKRAELPPEVWQFLKDKGFFGLNIPEEYGGLAFSAQGYAAVIAKIASRSGSVAVTVMAPNSLGPAELLLHYGTKAQKTKYLYRLARGQEIPCFVFDGADSMTGYVCEGEFAGEKKVRGIRLNWEKNYVTLAPAATLLGLAFRLHDPEQLLGGEIDRGITLALIPTDTPGVQIGRRHFPLNGAHLTGPTGGRDVFIPVDYIIGGADCAGQGWKMLMACQAAGRTSTAGSVGGMKLAARTSGAYCQVRRQLDLPAGQFEGSLTLLARIGANTYMVDAAHRFTALAQDLGQNSSAIQAIIRYQLTERGRQVVVDAMDVHGVKGVCLGPANYLGRLYQQIPVVVEDANIPGHILMVFGQGVMRTHPYFLKEINAARESGYEQGLQLFDDAMFGHVGFILSNMARSFVFGLFGARGIPVPAGGVSHRYYQHLTRFSAAFALSADVVVSIASMKRIERQLERLGDVLSLLYLCSATLKRFADDGSPDEDAPLVHWAMQDALYQIQSAFKGLIRNVPNVLVRGFMNALIFPIGANFAPPSDQSGQEAAARLMQPGATRDRLTAGMYLTKDEDEPLAVLEAALLSATACMALRAELAAAHQLVPALTPAERIAQAQELGIITAEQVRQLARDDALRRQVLVVDDFSPEALRARRS